MVKQEAPHHGVWYVQSFNLHVNPFVLFAVINICWLPFCRRWVKTRLPEVRALNQNTFFSVQEITEAYGVDSFVSVIYGDSKSYHDLLGVACVVASRRFGAANSFVERRCYQDRESLV
jgi:hypothetical protein